MEQDAEDLPAAEGILNVHMGSMHVHVGGC